MHFTILASGSKGNCTIVESKNTKIIIDCGSTKRYLTGCFDKLNFDYSQIDGLLITHCHSDHVSQLKMFKQADIYSPVEFKDINVNLIKPLEIFKIKELTILPIPLSHDCKITVGYIIFDGSETLVYLTDTGYVSQTNVELIKHADYYIVESNHDPQMLMQTDRPLDTKKRILSDNGHLSNQDSALLMCKCINENTKQIILAHISQQANTYELAYNTMIEILNEKKINIDNLFIKAVEQFEIFDSQINNERN